MKDVSSRWVALVAAGLLSNSPVWAEQQAGSVARPAFSKDVGPTSAKCDSVARGTADWSACIGAAAAKMPSAELFYAGYWLAKSGSYAEALRYLNLADKNDERVLTYIGYATRKLGDVDAALPIYARALEINPNFSVARAYLGEAFLSKNQPDRARAELAEIGTRCGTACVEYADLAAHIGAYDAAHALKG